jgi:mRNA interferase MazF
VIVVVITSNLVLEDAPGNVRISKSESGLAKHSVINVSQVVTLDRDLLTEKVRTLPHAVVDRVNEGLRIVLGL